MTKSNSDASILSISLDRGAKASLQSQLLSALRERVHDGRLRPGNRLPSSRNLAQELAVSRVTTTAVYDQLIAEGYLEARRGAGVFVASDLPDLAVSDPGPLADQTEAALPVAQPQKPFRVGLPDLASFPYRDWTRLFDRIWRAPGAELLGQIDPMGFGPLRTAIAAHLRDWRGLQCAPNQIIITSGLVEALELIAKATLTQGDRVLVETPGHKVLVNALNGCGMICEPVRVDGQGFNLDNARPDQLPARAIAVTPSRQYPLGYTMPLARRLELLDWAKHQGGYIFEDDYDGEFRYQGQPLPAMMSLDSDARVIYVGSFSKVMFPALRLGYMVVPPDLLPRVGAVLGRVGPRAALMAQPVLAEFIGQGALATHIRRMRRLYATRQQIFRNVLGEYADDLLSAQSETGGMHLVVEQRRKLTSHLSDQDIAAIASDLNQRVVPLSSFFFGQADQRALIMGYAAHDEETIETAVAELAQALRQRLP
jgi:GntR family transcriptional regulator/MocR family aminotransferase